MTGDLLAAKLAELVQARRYATRQHINAPACAAEILADLLAWVADQPVLPDPRTWSMCRNGHPAVWHDPTTLCPVCQA